MSPSRHWRKKGRSRTRARPDFVIFHISDLHFGDFLQGTKNSGEGTPFSPPHSFNYLLSLETLFRKLHLKYKDRLLVVITGDLTNSSEPTSFQQIYNFIFRKVNISDTERVGFDLADLGVKAIVVPGNHDVWFDRGLLFRWRRFAYRLEDFRKFFPTRLPNIVPLVNGTSSLTIASLDSNRIGTFINPYNFANVLGMGEVGRDQLAQLQAIHNSIINGTYPNVPKGYSYENSLRIALIHHHIQLPEIVSPTFKHKMLRLKDAPEVQNALCLTGTHMVLCGHQHFPFQIPKLISPQYPNQPLFLSCAGSPSQLGCSTKSLFLYEIYDRHNGFFRVNSMGYAARESDRDYQFRLQDERSFIIRV